MKGGVILFRGTGADALRYLESDRARAMSITWRRAPRWPSSRRLTEGRVVGEVALSADEYRQWVDWINPLTGESMGKPGCPAMGGGGLLGSRRWS
jgi:hypothetical protein